MPLFQAAAAAILFTFLFGMLIIRGKSRRIKDNDERKAQAAQVLYNRMMADRDVVQRRRVELGYDAVPPPRALNDSFRPMRSKKSACSERLPPCGYGEVVII